MATLEDLVQLHFQQESEHDVEAVLAGMTEDCYYLHVPLGLYVEGKAEVRKLHSELHVAYPDLEIEIINVFAGDNFACVETITRDQPGPISRARANPKASGKSRMQRVRISRRSHRGGEALL